MVLLQLGESAILPVLLVTTILWVSKPRGLTRYGQRRQHEQRKLLVP